MERGNSKQRGTTKLTYVPECEYFLKRRLDAAVYFAGTGDFAAETGATSSAVACVDLIIVSATRTWGGR